MTSTPRVHLEVVPTYKILEHRFYVEWPIFYADDNIVFKSNGLYLKFPDGNLIFLRTISNLNDIYRLTGLRYHSFYGENLKPEILEALRAYCRPL